MPIAVVDPALCRAEECPAGRCVARAACPTRAIVQVERYEAPALDPQRCRGCARCTPACPYQAIALA